MNFGNETELELSMVFCPDIAIYDYGLYMFLTENTIIVTEDGCGLITPIEQSIYG
jgi:Xaa-Pro aminopeptidase